MNQPPPKNPTYLNLAADCLGKETERWSGAETISIHSAASELLAWVNDERRYVRRFHYPAWESCIRELQHCLDNMGTSLREVLGSIYDKVTADFRACLINTEEPDRDNIRDDLEILLNVTRSPNALLACWRDYLRSCKRPEFSIAKIARLRDEFWDTARAGRHNQRELNSILKGILQDNSQKVYQAKLLLGEDVSTFPETVHARIHASANLGRRDCEQLCERIVGRPPREASHAVWLVYTAASINGYLVNAGPVQFFNGPALRKMTQDNPHFPKEFKDIESDYERCFPDEESFVMVRVDLGFGAISDAAYLARKQALAVVVAGSQHSSGRGGAWKETGSQIHVMDGRVVSQVLSKRAERPITAFQLEPLAYGIEIAAARVANFLPLGSTTLEDLLSFLDLWDQAKKYDAASAILANVRLIESLASYTQDEDWVRFSARAFKNDWILSDLVWKLRSALYSATQISYRLTNDHDRTQVNQVRDRVFSNKQGLIYSNMATALDALSKISQVYPEKELIGYELRSIERDYSDCNRLNQSRKLLMGRWNRALERLERVRNALTHGGPVTEEALLSVNAFSQKLAGGLIGVALDQMLNGKNIAEAMDELTRRGNKWENNALTASTPKDFLFGE